MMKISWILRGFHRGALAVLLAFWPPAIGWSQQTADRVRKLFSERCFACHGPDEDQRQGGFRLDLADSFLSAADSGEIPVRPGEPGSSELLRRIASSDDFERMPPPEFGAALSTLEIQLVRDWIEAGAQLPKHWSFVKPQRPDIPSFNELTAEQKQDYSDWLENPIDRFVLRRQLLHGLQPSPQADSATLLRRLSLDLTGLPATPEEVADCEQSISPKAYEDEVERLLASPRFGEHWARKWLDLARYADSAGYADDPPRTIWAYRDWVIRAFNSNLPVDQFTVEQIAGDLLPDPEKDHLIATAFNRNTLTNNEGGTNDEEFRNVAIVDRVNTTMAVWMGVTMACAQCHTHKYDPFTQEEYFQLFAIFNQTQDADRKDESPTLPLFTESQENRKRELERRLAQMDPEQGSEMERQRIAEQLADIEPYTSVPIMREVDSDSRRETFMQIRGNYKSLGQAVKPGTPDILHPLNNADDEERITRLDLAHWLVDRRNPLTARVWMNRMWESLFGIGLVRTSEEFGAQGDLPSHPELLDWLAIEFMESGWDFKWMLRQLVTSQTYRQSSQVADWNQDPDNIWLARGPRVRLSAEMIRDQALAVGGLLSSRMHGPPVRPPQPDMGLKAAFGGATDWEASQGENRYRRGIYTTWRRSNPYPSMAVFDAPSREVCTLRRDSTNTPLQALVTLNDPVFVEAAQGLARRVVLHSGFRDEEPRVRRIFELATCRPPLSAEIELLLQLLKDARQQLGANREGARVLATDPLGPLPAGSDPLELAAYTAVCNVVLNLDEVLMKR